jgi:hypothetical protein
MVMSPSPPPSLGYRLDRGWAQLSLLQAKRADSGYARYPQAETSLESRQERYFDAPLPADACSRPQETPVGLKAASGTASGPTMRRQLV